MEIIKTESAPAAIGPYSQAVKYNGIVYTSGQIALTPEGELVERDIKKQTHQVLTNLQNVLAEANSSLEKVLKVTIYLENMEDFGIVNVIYGEYFGDHKPARSTVAVKTLPKNVLVEMDTIAICDDIINL
ncbi:endoribonuclease L-PSP [Arcobacter nitrofigilis DSM 7299]|uniref:Endoribonuclease L-PSP n=1 Tax=Arcobacter nitrofigilis (strain ATCC 33309 / DSM 7299 / CCUG 15893 / LMG 7604 / NCTC 12251 / CI) TaxID=572480 RepID=D5V147_ARCNC|nr:RidA family protein [Arcobacter nitrofigilis]ADG94009.1 endoribonuclease L-PSP [Arcobacter nitrofigilis DSM 7299]